MRGKGINYDTGFSPGGRSSRAAFDPQVVQRELDIIARDLHCTAVRITGADPERLTIAAERAVNSGLDVWFSPVPSDRPTAELVPYFADCASRAAHLRKRSDREVVLVLGCELSAFASGFLPGDDVYQRLAQLSAPSPALYAAYETLLERFNAFLGETANAARREFGGRITYASGPWEQVDWRPFDIVAVDAYRDASNAATYEEQLRHYFGHDK